MLLIKCKWFLLTSLFCKLEIKNIQDFTGAKFKMDGK